jgi:hypothetical protein
MGFSIFATRFSLGTDRTPFRDIVRMAGLKPEVGHDSCVFEHGCGSGAPGYTWGAIGCGLPRDRGTPYGTLADRLKSAFCPAS